MKIAKCAQIPDEVFCRAIAETPAPEQRPTRFPTEAPYSYTTAYLIRHALRFGGWEQKTPWRRPEPIRRRLEQLLDAPIAPKLFHAKARKLEARGLINAYEHRWHLAAECLDSGCCPGAPNAERGPALPVTDEEIALMERIEAEYAERARRDPFPPLMPYDLSAAVPLLYYPRTVGKSAALLRAQQRSPIHTGSVGCRQHPESGTWIHVSPHTCPVQARSAMPRRRRR